MFINFLQARAIILLASREMEERLKTPRMMTSPGSEPCSPSLQSPIYSPTTALSMKKSLQRFLQKRKHRAQAMSPYHRWTCFVKRWYHSCYILFWFWPTLIRKIWSCKQFLPRNFLDTQTFDMGLFVNYMN